MAIKKFKLNISEKKSIKILVTSIAILAVIVHLFFPSTKIDAITVTLLVIALFPWLEPLFKSVELPGGIKMEFQQLEKVAEEAKEAGLIKPKEEADLPKESTNKNKYAFVEVAPINQQLALIGLRIEIEKRLRLLAEKYSVEIKGLSLHFLIQKLNSEKLLNNKETSVFNEMITTFNRASHGIEYDPRNAEWIMVNGPEILESLDSKLDVRGGRFSVGSANEAEHWIDKSYKECKKDTTLAWNMCISKHAELWEKELENIYNALLKKLKTPQLENLIASEIHWEEQRKLDQSFILSFGDLRRKVGSSGNAVIGLNFMNKIKERTLELEEILNHFVD